jgi:hypothetical protein
MRKRGSIAEWLFSSLYLAIGLFFFFIPGLRLASDLNDSALRSGAIPQAAWRLHAHLAPRYAAWARERVASKRATQLDDQDVPSTEWPLFGTVFYLLSLESLQQAWETDHTLATVAPAVYARPAIEASLNLVMDPNQATWVEDKYGDDYLDREDLFYRFLRISAMASYTHLTGDTRLAATLRNEVDSLSTELAASSTGLLEDYPGECYPGDVVAAIAAIRRADAVLGTDHSVFVQQALRGFAPPQVDAYGLPPFMASATSGAAEAEPRGCGNSYILDFAPEIWPAAARGWYQSYDAHYWQRGLGIAGFREFSRDTPKESTFNDVDSGPVIFGFGVSASAFGVGAARVNGHMDEAGPLTAEMLATSWPLADGTLLLPRLLSYTSGAPYLGEAGILFCLTRQPPGRIQKEGGSVMTPFVWAVLLFYFGMAAFFMRSFVVLMLARFRPARKSPREPHSPAETTQTPKAAGHSG